METMQEMVEAVKRHAFSHYDKGWDVVLETYTDGEIATAIGGAKTVRGAIRKMGAEARLYCSHRGDIQGETF